MTVSTEIATTPKTTKSRNSDSSVSRGINSNWDCDWIWICTKEFGFLDLVDFGGVAFSVETGRCRCVVKCKSCIDVCDMALMSHVIWLIYMRIAILYSLEICSLTFKFIVISCDIQPTRILCRWVISHIWVMWHIPQRQFLFFFSRSTRRCSILDITYTWHNLLWGGFA